MKQYFFLLIIFLIGNVSLLSQIPKKPVSLKNTGNSCFINSIIQLICSIPEIRNELEKKDPFPSNTQDKKEQTLNALAQLIRAMYSTKATDIKELLKKFNNGVWQDLLEVERCSQQDAQELLIKLLEALDKNNYWNALLKKQLDIAIYSTISCPGDYISNNFNHEFIIHLTLIDGASNLDQLINHFITPEELDEYKDNTDTSRSGCTKTSSITQSPPYIIVSLKRYHPTLGKINSKIEMPLLFNFPIVKPEVSTSEQPYELISFTYHQGVSLGGGHYIAYVKKDEDNWYQCNDSTINTVKTDANDFIAMRNTGYIYVYKRIDAILIDPLEKEQKLKETQLKNLEISYKKLQETLNSMNNLINKFS